MTTPIKEEEDLGYEPAKMEMANTVLVDASKNDDGTTRDLNKHCKYVFGAGSGFGGVVHRLGRGGQGDVFLAQDVRTGRFNIALKIVSIENGANRVDLAREVELYKSLNKQAESEFIVMMKDFFVIKMEGGLVKSVAMSFKYHEQGSLQDYADFNGGKLDIADVKTAVRCVARALQIIHEKDFAHRDLKPDNCLVECDLYGKLVIVRLCDLGLVRRIKGDSYCEDLTANVGTPGYQSPDNATGQAYDPAKNDVFGLGALAFRISSGRKLNPMVYAVAGDGRRTTKAARKADANAKKLIYQERDVLKAELRIGMSNEIIKCLYTTEAQCPKLEDILKSDFLIEGGSASNNDVVHEDVLDEDDSGSDDAVVDDTGVAETGPSNMAEAEHDLNMMLIIGKLTDEEKIGGLVSWRDFLSDFDGKGSAWAFYAIFVRLWNDCVDGKNGNSFTVGILGFLSSMKGYKTTIINEILRLKLCRTNADPSLRYSPSLPGSDAEKWRKDAQNLAEKLRLDFESKMNELEQAGTSLKIEDIQKVIALFFSTNDGFKQIPDTERRFFCRRLHAIHVHSMESAEDTDDGSESANEKKCSSCCCLISQIRGEVVPHLWQSIGKASAATSYRRRIKVKVSLGLLLVIID